MLGYSQDLPPSHSAGCSSTEILLRFPRPLPELQKQRLLLSWPRLCCGKVRRMSAQLLVRAGLLVGSRSLRSTCQMVVQARETRGL